jgi:hypothetical protein
MLGKIISIFIFVLIMISTALYASEFDELEKPPEGAHKGQMLLGAFVSMGKPYGNFIDSEDKFLKGSKHDFDSENSKLIEVSHLSFGMGITYEYMPFDYFGTAAKLRKNYISQQTNFGPDYQNWRGFLYKDTSFLIGPTVHATTRKRWDFILTPLIGYNFATYYAAPVAKQIIGGTTGSRKRSSKGLSYGAELNCTLYFSGGLFISLGGEWIRNNLKLSEPVRLTYSLDAVTTKEYNSITTGNISSWSVVLSVGYAFSN